MLALDVTGDLPHARALALRQLEISDQHELVFFRALASVHLGTIDARLEHADGGIERVRQGGEQLRAMGNRLAYPYAQKCLAQALLATGRAREASHVATQTLTYCEGKLAAPYVPMLLGVRAQAAEQCASYAEAEHDYVRAIAILDTQAATHAALELTLPLARMLRDNGRLQAARERLAHARGLDRDDYPTHTREEAQQLQLELGVNVT
jgi:tetratricopeptide (TPR) repeat protein